MKESSFCSHQLQHNYMLYIVLHHHQCSIPSPPPIKTLRSILYRTSSILAIRALIKLLLINAYGTAFKVKVLIPVNVSIINTVIDFFYLKLFHQCNSLHQYPAGNYMFKVNNRNTTYFTPCSSVPIVNFE